jgi:hypothetical protein
LHCPLNLFVVVSIFDFAKAIAGKIEAIIRTLPLE